MEKSTTHKYYAQVERFDLLHGFQSMDNGKEELINMLGLRLLFGSVRGFYVPNNNRTNNNELSLRVSTRTSYVFGLFVNDMSISKNTLTAQLTIVSLRP